MKVNAIVVHSFQHDRFYAQGERVPMDQALFDDLEPGGLVKMAPEAPEGEVEAPKTKAKAK